VWGDVCVHMNGRQFKGWIVSLWKLCRPFMLLYLYALCSIFAVVFGWIQGDDPLNDNEDYKFLQSAPGTLAMMAGGYFWIQFFLTGVNVSPLLPTPLGLSVIYP
jgi:hypothetical protein